MSLQHMKTFMCCRAVYKLRNFNQLSVGKAVTGRCPVTARVVSGTIWLYIVSKQTA
jgi:hypothetical protein